MTDMEPTGESAFMIHFKMTTKISISIANFICDEELRDDTRFVCGVRVVIVAYIP